MLGEFGDVRLALFLDNLDGQKTTKEITIEQKKHSIFLLVARDVLHRWDHGFHVKKHGIPEAILDVYANWLIQVSVFFSLALGLNKVRVLLTRW